MRTINEQHMRTGTLCHNTREQEPCVVKIKELFEQTEKLYHFTKFDTALKIIESNCLRFGRLDNMNDIHENDKMEFVDANVQIIDEFPSEVLDALHDEIYKYRQISLTAEGEPGNKLGFDLHQMWGLYADKSEGVCLRQSSLLRI